MFLAGILSLTLAKAPDMAFDPGPAPLLMRHPTLSKTSIVFSFAGDLWSVARAGGDAVRLTSAPGIEADPFFSPDGSTIAFTGTYDGNVDVYTIPAEGGVPKRLTYDPAADVVAGWTPDGKSIVFASNLLSNTDAPRLFTVGLNGGIPKALPFPMGTMASFSPDGAKLAYVPGFKWELAWKRYRGGQTYPIWIANMADSKVKEIPRNNTNDEQPMWMGDKIYYLSDKRGPVGLYSYDTKSGKVNEEIKGEGFDIKSASAGPDAIVYERLGSINLFDPATRESHRVPVAIHGDFPEVRPEFKDLRANLNSASISPSGQRAVVSARGWIFTVPAAKGDARALGEEQALNRRDPAWSPDARTIAYMTDANDKQQLALFDLTSGKERLLQLGEAPAYYYGPAWSPDSKTIAYTDNRLTLWTIDVATGKNTKIDQGSYADPNTSLSPRWSADSKWLTWSRDLDNHFNAVFLYSFDTGKKSQVTDGLSNAKSPIFDRSGQYLYFYASTNTGLAGSWLDLSSFNNPNVLSSVYAVVLRKDLPNPLQPESDEEAIKEEAAKTPQIPPGSQNPATNQVVTKAPAAAPAIKPDAGKMTIDLDDIEHRIIALPMPTQAYAGLEDAPAGSFFALATNPRSTPTDNAFGSTLWKYTMVGRSAIPFARNVVNTSTSADGNKILIQGFGGPTIVSTMAPPAPGQGAIDLSGLRLKIDPHSEWDHMFHEVWRNEPILFYAPNLHGISAVEMDHRYAPFLKNICSRDDLNYLFTDMLGEMCIGHMWASGGDIPGIRGVPGGLLGADYAFENGHYRLTRIYDGERWNPGLYAPLAQPGVNAKVGEYVLEIDGKELKDSNDIYEKLEGKSGKQVKVKIGPNPNGSASREVTVVPVANDGGLRGRAWSEDNRRLVDKMTGGRVGYVHIPDTATGGWTEFNRYYYAQVGKDAMIVDERFNHGGLINDYMINEMTRSLNGVFTPRTGKDWPTPGSAIFGPKVMIANQFAGSGGDMFPWLFKHAKVGPVVGKRTWGGLVAAWGFDLADGGHINSPNCAFYNPESGMWDVENHGVDPDIEVEMDPYLWRQGHDPQLDKAIETMQKLLKNWSAAKIKKPSYPDKTKIDVRF